MRVRMTDIFQGTFEQRDEAAKQLLRIEDSFDLIRAPFHDRRKTGGILYGRRIFKG